MSTVECSSVQNLMSPFIDSMVTIAEAERLESHVAGCEPCHRQLQSYISMRSLVARIDVPPLPEDMVLETRVRLSHARNSNLLVRLENRLNNFLRPMIVPALLGAALTMLLFGFLLGSLTSQSTVLAQDHFDEQPVYRLFQPVRTENANWIRFASNDKQDLEEPLTIETYVGHEGRVLDYQVLSGPQNPEVNGWIRQMLSLAQFTPATAFGKPVESRMILSFVAVRN
jgi:putative zinc finger protein